MKKTLFIKNAALLTATSLIIRFAGIVFKVRVAAIIGAEGMGLYQLVLSLFLLAAAFTQSGIPTAVTRLVAAESALGGRSGIKRIMSAAFFLTLVLGGVTCVVLFLFADVAARLIIADSRAVLAIRVTSSSVLFMGVSSVVRGYFIARRKAAPGAFSQLIEQCIRIAVVVALLKKVSSAGISAMCAAVFAGDAAAEAICCIYLLLRYRSDFSRLPPGGAREASPIKRITAISLPLISGRYINSFLRTAESMLVPRSLIKYSKKRALSLFGMIRGMALPVLFFPSVLLGAISTLLIPEMTEAKERSKAGIVRSAVEQAISNAAKTGILFSALFAAGGYKIGALLYGSHDVGFLLTALSPIVPLMYIDSLCDGLLKGLDQQKFTFFVAVGDSALRLFLLFPAVGRFGINGFIGIMYFSNLLTCFLNVRRAVKISGAVIDTKNTVLVPVLSAFSVSLLTKAALSFIKLPDLVYITLLCAVSLPVYLGCLIYFDCINLSSLGRMRRHKRYAAANIRASLIK